MIRTDVVVVGGGLLGCATAWTLARDGVGVVLLERDQINAHASGQNAGSLHFQLEYRMVERGLEAAQVAAEAMPLHLDAAARWSELGEAFGPSLGVAQTGGLMLAETADQARVLEAKGDLERSHGLDVRLLSGDEIRDVAPYLSPSIVAAAFCPIEGKADTRTAAPALARAAADLGAQVSTRTEVVGLRRVGRGWQVSTRHTDAVGNQVGEEIQADVVLLAAGVWTQHLGQMVGLDLPIIPLALQMNVTARTPKFLPHLVQHAGERLSLKQSQDGTVLIGGGWPARLRRDASGRPRLSERPHLLHDSVVGNARAALRAVPRLAGIPLLRTWVGMTTVAEDQLPVVGPVPGRPGLFLATGGSAFTLGPTFARVLADLAQGLEPTIDLAPYGPQRFGESIDVA
ncbi:NAD(P)/FAD-dependent oxidoreductase [Ornithinimicrobium cavernae]|uniref:NAD(P)/FAD-dependent oxidoreductase n=1 Tax=Ornithinimicrobium cavernae TaxID=2666047 RepID=UPI000D69BA33|nr:FAD-binding oxidoreductase [Ornithinimicrobium cavernae]